MGYSKTISLVFYFRYFISIFESCHTLDSLSEVLDSENW